MEKNYAKNVKEKEMNNIFSIEGKVAIVTGAGSGIGKAIADGFRKAGAIVYYGIHNLKEEDKNDKFKIQLEISDGKNCNDLLHRMLNEQNKLDILVNVAGITISGYATFDWETTLNINLTSIFKFCKNAHYLMINGGSIINTTSICGDIAFSNNPSYNVSKSGLKILTKSMAKDWAKNGIRVNNLCPGYFATKMTQGSQNDSIKYKKRCERIMMGRFGNVEEMVGPAIFLASDASSYITASDLVCDGGFLSNGI